MLGEDVLVAPVVVEHQRQRRLYLPLADFQWQELHTQKIFTGGQHIEISAPLTHLPVFIKQGLTV
jgi:alpha-glucosidase (family GH31 glycosyl hydrolase)